MSMANIYSVFDPPEDNPVHKFSRSVVPQGKRVKDQTFGFDRIFDDNASQGDVYEGTTRTLLDSVLDGYNATVFAYGATGCGKTHTITGTVQQPGIIFLTMQELFERISESSNEKVSEISLSYLEIYNETIRDLLAMDTSSKGLTLREDANQAVSVSGLSSHNPQNVQEVMDMIVRGNENRTMSPTEANATSSRSHAVLQINVSQKDRNASVNEPHTMATLSIIDLAGSERASATKNRGERLVEGANINKSLLALGSCINALCDPRKKNHVPYRNSKLTRLLKFSLGGNCRTVMIVCVSPSSAHFDETQNTLRYANRAKNIQTKVTRNVYNVNRHVKDFLVKIDEQMAMINELKQQQKDYEAIAFTKFRKQGEKRDSIVKEGIARIRNAYEHSTQERLEKGNNMKKLKQIERRIAIISAWVSAFDQVCDTQEDETILQNLATMKKTGQGIMLELENSRHHYRQKIAKSNWERAVDSALQTGLRQLRELESLGDLGESSNLTREVEILKSNAEREALVAVAEQEKGTDVDMVQILVKAHFETIAAVQNLMGMGEQEAVQAAKGILGSLLKNTTEVACHIVQPNGNIAIVESFPPTKTGTPKRKKNVNLVGGTPMRLPKPVIPPDTSLVVSSPARLTPKRRKMGGAKKGISFTPKKKSPAKAKRVVRWRDDTEDGKLADFEKTPQKLFSTPEVSSVEVAPSVPPQSVFLEHYSENDDLSPSLPPPPEPSLEIRLPKSDRFRSGFLSKRSNGSPTPPTMTRLSSDSERSSPLRDLEPSKASNRRSVSKSGSPFSSNVSGSNLNNENVDQNSASPSSSDSEGRALKNSKLDLMKVKSAIKRSSLTSGSGNGVGPMRTQRRRSPTAASNPYPTNGSPPSAHESMFTVSQARRMGAREKGEWRHSVLSPRSDPIIKGPARRTTMSILGDGTSAARVHEHGGRGSFVNGKGVWR
jgi:kinesin family member 18/19